MRHSRIGGLLICTGIVDGLAVQVERNALIDFDRAGQGSAAHQLHGVAVLGRGKSLGEGFVLVHADLCDQSHTGLFTDRPCAVSIGRGYIACGDISVVGFAAERAAGDNHGARPERNLAKVIIAVLNDNSGSLLVSARHLTPDRSGKIFIKRKVGTCCIACNISHVDCVLSVTRGIASATLYVSRATCNIQCRRPVCAATFTLNTCGRRID